MRVHRRSTCQATSEEGERSPRTQYPGNNCTEWVNRFHGVIVEHQANTQNPQRDADQRPQRAAPKCVFDSLAPTQSSDSYKIRVSLLRWIPGLFRSLRPEIWF